MSLQEGERMMGKGGEREEWVIFGRGGMRWKGQFLILCFINSSIRDIAWGKGKDGETAIVGKESVVP